MGSGHSKANNRHGSKQHAKSRTMKTSRRSKKESAPSMSTLPSSQQQEQQPAEQKIGDKVGKQIVKEYYTLKKTEQRCTGLYWREDPRPDTPRLTSGDNWPRDFAKLKGQIILDPFHEEWLLVSHIMQPNEITWKQAPIGATIPFEEYQYYLE